jgi:hypothetical protein
MLDQSVNQTNETQWKTSAADRLRCRIYRLTHKEYFRDYMNRYNSDPTKKKAHNSREQIRRIKLWLFSCKPANTTINTLCWEVTNMTSFALKTHLIRTFVNKYDRMPLPGEKVEIDHIIPLGSATSPEEISELNNWQNLTLITYEDNRLKSSLDRQIIKSMKQPIVSEVEVAS